MTFSRRGFLAAGIVTAGAGAAGTAAAAETAALAGGRSVTDFGVQTGLEAVQTAALQKAIYEISRSGHPVFFPGGHYATGTLKLPAGCALAGPGGAAVLHAKGAGTVFQAELPAATGIVLSGLTVDGGAAVSSGNPSEPLVSLAGADVTLVHLRLMNAPGSALRLERCTGFLQNVTVAGARGAGLLASGAGALTVTGCDVSACQAEGIKASGERPAGSLVLSENQITACSGAGLAVAGSAVVTSNSVSRSRFGLKLGGGGDGHIMATGNLLRQCRIGIAVTASGETVLASINLINEPEEGAIRAFDGDALVGPDLARESAESYLNLTVAGNVVR